MEPLEAPPYLSKKVINFAHKQNLLIQYSEGIFSSYERAETITWETENDARSYRPMKRPVFFFVILKDWY